MSQAPQASPTKKPMIEDMTSHVLALLDYFESQDINANQAMVLCSFVAGIGAGQASKDFERQELMEAIPAIAEYGVGVADSAEESGACAIHGNGRWSKET